MKITKLVHFMLLLTVAVFLVDGFTQDLPTGAIARIDIGEGPVNAIAYSRSENRIAVAAAENIHIYDASTYKKLTVFNGHTDLVLALAFSPNGKFLVSGSLDKTARLWNIDLGKLIHTYKKHTGSINAVAFSTKGEKFKSGSNEHADVWYLYLDHLRSGKSGSYMPTNKFTATAFSYAGEIEARAFDSVSVLDDTLVKLLSENGRKIEKSIVFLESSDRAGFLSAHTASVNVLTLFAKGKILATGSVDKTIQLWNANTTINTTTHITKPLHILSGHTGGIAAMDFSVNGKLLASGGSDKTIRLWDVATGQHLHTFTGHTGEIGAVTFLGDKALARTAFAKDKALASGSSDGTVIIWDLGKVIPND